MIRFYNGRVLSFGGGMKISRGEVWTDGGRIVHVGDAPGVLPEFDRQIDLSGKLLMPGFKNAHTHTAMVFFRSLADDMPLQSWLSEQVWPREGKLTGEAVYDLTKLGITEYLSSFFGVDMNTLTSPQTAADAELNELLETLRSRDDMRMLFKLAKDATPDDVRKAVKIIEALYND